MGFFGLFGKKKSGLAKHAERVANKRAQAPDRWESIQALGKIATTEPEGGSADERADAVAALLERFTFNVDPTITDGEEKDEAFRWISGAGDAGVPAVRTALGRHESISWPLKCLEALVPGERLNDELMAVLGKMDTEYERDPQRKLQLLGVLEQQRDPSIAPAVAPFFLDMNEEARFHAVRAALPQENASDVVPLLAEALAEEDSVRVKVLALEAMAENGWSLGDHADAVALPEGWTKDKKGVPRPPKR